MCIYIYIYTYVHISFSLSLYIYIYLYTCFPGNSLDVSVAFPSFTFPLRFCHVSVAFPSAFPSRFRRISVTFSSTPPLRKCPPDGNYPQTLATFLCFLMRAAGQIPSQTRLGTVVPTSSLNLRSRVRSLGSTLSGRVRRYAANGNRSVRQMRCGPRGRTDPIVFRLFRGVSANVSATFPSIFPWRFRQRFRCVSVNVSVAFPLGRCVPDGNYPETLPAFPGPTKHICVYVYLYISLYIYIYIHTHDLWVYIYIYICTYVQIMILIIAIVIIILIITTILLIIRWILVIGNLQS